MIVRLGLYGNPVTTARSRRADRRTAVAESARPLPARRRHRPPSSRGSGAPTPRRPARRPPARLLSRPLVRGDPRGRGGRARDRPARASPAAAAPARAARRRAACAAGPERGLPAAIATHTVGRGMTSSRSVSILPTIEPGRDFPGVEELRGLAANSIDEALRSLVRLTIVDLVERRRRVHPATVALYNELHGSKDTDIGPNGWRGVAPSGRPTGRASTLYVLAGVVAFARGHGFDLPRSAPHRQARAPDRRELRARWCAADGGQARSRWAPCSSLGPAGGDSAVTRSLSTLLVGLQDEYLLAGDITASRSTERSSSAHRRARSTPPIAYRRRLRAGRERPARRRARRDPATVRSTGDDARFRGATSLPTAICRRPSARPARRGQKSATLRRPCCRRLRGGGPGPDGERRRRPAPGRRRGGGTESAEPAPSGASARRPRRGRMLPGHGHGRGGAVRLPAQQR